MGAIKLGLRCPQNVNGIAADPQPDWSFDKLLAELNSIDKDLNLTLDFPSPFTKTEPRNLKSSKDKRGFVICVSDDETNYADSDSDSDVEVGNSLVVSGSGRRFVCDELYVSDDSEDGTPLGMQSHQLMDKVGLAEGAIHELTHELRLSVTVGRSSSNIVGQKQLCSATDELVDEDDSVASTTY